MKNAAIALCFIVTASLTAQTLRSSRVSVDFDAARGLPSEYQMLWNKAVLHGASSRQKVAVTYFRRSPYAFLKATPSPVNAIVTPKQVDFHFTLPAATFTIRYALDGATLRVSLENVAEKPGFELIDVALPELASIREEDSPGWLAHGDSGGSVVELSRATPGRLPQNRFWGGVAATLPVVMIGTAKAICVEEVMSYMDTTELAVEGDAGHRRAGLGTVQVYRVNGSLPQDLNLAAGESKVPGNERTPNLLVGQRSVTRLDFIGDLDGDGKLDWLDGAKLVRARMPAIPTHYYDDKFQYSLHSDEPKYPKPGATFAETEKITRQIANLTAFQPQTVYLWGWQYRGKDTGYPAVDQVNPRLGTFEDMQSMIARARDWNATISFSDNFDDAYKSSPAWDDAMIARRPDGGLWKSRNWTGEDSYILGMAKYMKGPGPARIRYTCDHYRLRDTYLVDVLSYYSIRNDWDAEHPASGIANLEGRMKVLDGFKSCGLDVVSEELRYPFIGKIAVVDNGPVGGTDPFSGEAIPLVAAIYRKSAIWGLRGPQKRDNSILHTLFYNGHGFPWATIDTNLEEFTAFFYETIVPWYQVHYRDIQTFERKGDRTRIGLEGNTSIDIDWKSGQYAVALNGVEIAKNGDTFAPLGTDRVAFYSKMGGELRAALPAGWDGKALVARALYADRMEAVEALVRDGSIVVTAPARRPIVIFRNQAVITHH